jgi:hypothetical protein
MHHSKAGACLRVQHDICKGRLASAPTATSSLAVANRVANRASCTVSCRNCSRRGVCPNGLVE